jgi:hypothetical protein
MRKQIQTSFFLCLAVSISSAGCRSGTEVGCTIENCRRMASSCRVELNGGASAACWLAGEQPVGFDSSKYCVEDCRHQGAGALVRCIAERAERCDAVAGPDFDARLAIVDECRQSTGGSDVNPSPACEAQCASTRKQCDLACVGGERCGQCRRSGASCEGCFDAGFAACTDCSAACGADFVDCLQSCGS